MMSTYIMYKTGQYYGIVQDQPACSLQWFSSNVTLNVPTLLPRFEGLPGALVADLSTRVYVIVCPDSHDLTLALTFLMDSNVKCEL